MSLCLTDVLTFSVRKCRTTSSLQCPVPRGTWTEFRTVNWSRTMNDGSLESTKVGHVLVSYYSSYLLTPCLL